MKIKFTETMLINGDKYSKEWTLEELIISIMERLQQVEHGKIKSKFTIEILRDEE